MERNNLFSLTFASVMPPWIYALFFDPERERERLEVHDYQIMQQTRVVREMDHCKLLDEIKLPLKNFTTFLHAINHANENAFQIIFSHFFAGNQEAGLLSIMSGKINTISMMSHYVKNIIPFIGPLHIKLNSRESVSFKHKFTFLVTERYTQRSQKHGEFYLLKRLSMVVGPKL